MGPKKKKKKKKSGNEFRLIRSAED